MLTKKLDGKIFYIGFTNNSKNLEFGLIYCICKIRGP
jgi:hypothetical protein